MKYEFSPSAYDYEPVDSPDGVYRYQKITVKKDKVITDIIELAWVVKDDYWVIFVDPESIREMFPKHPFPEDDGHPINLYVGEIRCDEDYEFLINRIVKKPEIIKLLAGTVTTFGGIINMKEKPDEPE